MLKLNKNARSRGDTVTTLNVNLGEYEFEVEVWLCFNNKLSLKTYLNKRHSSWLNNPGP